MEHDRGPASHSPCREDNPIADARVIANDLAAIPHAAIPHPISAEAANAAIHNAPIADAQVHCAKVQCAKPRRLRRRWLGGAAALLVLPAATRLFTDLEVVARMH